MDTDTKKRIISDLNNPEKVEILAIYPGQGDKLGHIAISTDFNQSPLIVRECARLRQEAFEKQNMSLGLGKLDWDEHDLRREKPYKSFLILNQDELVHNDKVIFEGGYRYFIPDETTKPEDVAITEVFKLLPRYLEEILPNTMDLGRSFIRPEYQTKANERLGSFIQYLNFRTLASLYLKHTTMQEPRETKKPQETKKQKNKILAFGGKITLRMVKSIDELEALYNTLSFLNIIPPHDEYVKAHVQVNYNSQLKEKNLSPEEFIKYYEKWYKTNNQLLGNNLVKTYYESAKNKGEPTKMQSFGTGWYFLDEERTQKGALEHLIRIPFKDLSDVRKKLLIQPFLKEQYQEGFTKAIKDYDFRHGLKLD